MQRMTEAVSAGVCKGSTRYTRLAGAVPNVACRQEKRIGQADVPVSPSFVAGQAAGRPTEEGRQAASQRTAVEQRRTGPDLTGIEGLWVEDVVDVCEPSAANSYHFGSDCVPSSPQGWATVTGLGG